MTLRGEADTVAAGLLGLPRRLDKEGVHASGLEHPLRSSSAGAGVHPDNPTETRDCHAGVGQMRKEKGAASTAPER